MKWLQKINEAWKKVNEAPSGLAVGPKTQPAVSQEQFAPVAQENRLDVQRRVVAAIKADKMPSETDLITLGIKVYEGNKRDFVVKQPEEFVARESYAFPGYVGPDQRAREAGRLYAAGAPARTRQFIVTLNEPESGLLDEVVPIDGKPSNHQDYVRAVDIASQNRAHRGRIQRVTLLY